MDKRLMAKLKFALLVLAELAGLVFIFLSREKVNSMFMSDYGSIFAMVVFATFCTSFELRLLEKMKQA